MSSENDDAAALEFELSSESPSDDYVEGFLEGVGAMLSRSGAPAEGFSMQTLDVAEAAAAAGNLIGEWKGNDNKIKHDYGHKSDINPDWWQGHGGRGWCCFGPYVKLQAGRYRFQWDLRMKYGKPSGPVVSVRVAPGVYVRKRLPWHYSEEKLLAYDVCHSRGRTQVLTRYVDWVWFWRHSEGQFDGVISHEFSLRDTIPEIEVRISALGDASECHYQWLKIFKID